MIRFNLPKIVPILSSAIIAAQYGNKDARQQVEEFCMEMSKHDSALNKAGLAIMQLLDGGVNSISLDSISDSGRDLLCGVIDEITRVSPEIREKRAHIYYATPQSRDTASNGEAMLNQNLDVDILHGLFKQTKRIQIVNLLIEESAKHAHESLKNQVPWVLRMLYQGKHTEYSHEEYSQLSPQQLALLQSNHWDMDFIYQQFKPVITDGADTANQPYIYDVIEYLQSDHFGAFLKKLTGCELIQTLDTRGTCLMPGHFLKQHDDFNPGGHRLYAYVLNLSRDWQADWGGLLQFMNAQGDVTDTLIPRFNSLSLFATPAPHQVTPVTPFAKERRYSLTGWLYNIANLDLQVD